jgi:hypothetical protein
MKAIVKNYTKRDGYGNFISGKVFFESLVTHDEYKAIPDSLTVNLSKSLKPECETPIKNLQDHNHHSGSFDTYTLMRAYVQRVAQDLIKVVQDYNMSIEDEQSSATKLDYITLDDNEDLVAIPLSHTSDSLQLDAYMEALTMLLGEEGLFRIELDEDEE